MERGWLKEGNKMREKFVHSLRVQLLPDLRFEKRVADVIKHCKEYGFTDVMLMINAEEFNKGHITISEARPWVEKLKWARAEILKSGLTVSLNNWTEIGHLDRGRSLKDGQNFTTMVDKNGRKSTLVACPLCKEWEKYFLEYTAFLVSELEPDYFWIEDDFRYHNHAPLEWGGCFCELHIAEFNRRLGTSYTREEFVALAFEKGAPTPERHVWLDTERDSLIALAKKIGETVNSASNKTKVALMSSMSDAHCMEGRDWGALLSAMSMGKGKTNRIHLPFYCETSGKDYVYAFNKNSMAVRYFSGDDTEIWPEAENGNFTFYRKSPRAFRFHLEASMPLCLSGMTYSLYGFVGNGAVEAGYANEAKRLAPYFSAVKGLDIKFSSLQGVTVPIFETACYHNKSDGTLESIAPKSLETGAYLASLGMAYHYTSNKDIKGQTVALFGDVATNFTDGELEALFKNNFIILDGTCVGIIAERGLLSLISANSLNEVCVESESYAYETLTDDTRPYGIEYYRSSLRGVGNNRLCSVKYDPDVKILTQICDNEDNASANGFALKEGFLVMPYYLTGNSASPMYCGMRRGVIKDTVLAKSSVALISKEEGIFPYLYKGDDKSYIMLTNANLDDFENITLQLKGISFKKISFVDYDGKIKELDFTFNENTLVIDKSLPHYSNVTLVLK